MYASDELTHTPKVKCMRQHPGCPHFMLQKHASVVLVPPLVWKWMRQFSVFKGSYFGKKNWNIDYFGIIFLNSGCFKKYIFRFSSVTNTKATYEKFTESKATKSTDTMTFGSVKVLIITKEVKGNAYTFGDILYMQEIQMYQNQFDANTWAQWSYKRWITR